LFEVASWFPEDVAKFGVPFSLMPWLFAWLAAASEAIGGLFLAAGFQTRISAFLILCTMLVAVFFQKWDQGTWAMLPAMGFLWVSIYSLILGSGKLSFDYLISKRLLARKENIVPALNT
jgi:putative oxidoreductase